MDDRKIRLDAAARAALREAAQRKSRQLAAAEGAAADPMGDGFEASLRERESIVKERMNRAFGEDRREDPTDEELSRNMESNWAAIQKRMAEKGGTKAPAKRPFPWATVIGALAAAVVLLVVMRPRSPELVTTDGGLTKGAGDQAPALLRCEMSLVPESGEARVKPDGRTFVVPVGVPLRLRGECQEAAKVHVAMRADGKDVTELNGDVGPEASLLRGAAAAAPWDLGLARPGTAHVVLYVTKDPVPNGTPVPAAPFAETMGGATVLWSDDITFVAE